MAAVYRALMILRVSVYVILFVIFICIPTPVLIVPAIVVWIVSGKDIWGLYALWVIDKLEPIWPVGD